MASQQKEIADLKGAVAALQGEIVELKEGETPGGDARERVKHRDYGFKGSTVHPATRGEKLTPPDFLKLTIAKIE